MKYYVFDTLEEAESCNLECYNHLLSITDNIKYKDCTTNWSIIKTRLTDGKYVIPYYNGILNNTWLVEESEENWFEN